MKPEDSLPCSQQPLLVPILSQMSVRPVPTSCVTFCNKLFLYSEELLVPLNPQASVLPLVGCRRLLLHPKPEDAPCRGDTIHITRRAKQWQHKCRVFVRNVLTDMKLRFNRSVSLHGFNVRKLFYWRQGSSRCCNGRSTMGAETELQLTRQYQHNTYRSTFRTFAWVWFVTSCWWTANYSFKLRAVEEAILK